MGGWVKIHRCLLDNPIVGSEPKRLAIWIYLLLNATHTEIQARFNGQTITLKKGQLITGRDAIAKQFGVSSSFVQRSLKLLENEQQIEQQTTRHNRLITLLNWDIYQNGEQQVEQVMNNKRTTNEQLMNTNKKERKKECKTKEFIPPTIEEINSYITEKGLFVEGRRFLNYFTESNWVDSNGKEVKNWRLKLQTWDSYKSKDNKVITLPNRRLTPQEQVKAAKDKYFIK